MSSEAASSLSSLSVVMGVLVPVMDIVDGRVDEPEPPAWCERRGWVDFLLSLDDDELGHCEAEGLAPVVSERAGAPHDLRELARSIISACRLPSIDDRASPSRAALRSVGLRKQKQLSALLAAVGPMAERASRLVDVGAGSGHFTRLAAETFERESLGVDRDEARLRAASSLAQARVDEGARGASLARFEALDAFAGELSFGERDLAVGLHACGEVGDRLVVAAAKAGCDVALVSCCFQKVTGDARPPLSAAGRGLVLRKDVLGLANLTSRPEGVETSLAETLAAREARFALHRLLRSRGLSVSPGEAMRGINRRRAHAGLSELARAALASRGLAPADEGEIAFHEREARRLYGAVRRLSLPRHMLSRLVEIAVVLDRASLLEERGYTTRVAQLLEAAGTPRNVALLASRHPPSGLAQPSGGSVSP